MSDKVRVPSGTLNAIISLDRNVDFYDHDIISKNHWLFGRRLV